jgi:NarL family two-component system response regulator LiaR
MHRSEDYLREALAVGVDGYLLKEDADVALFAAIEAVRQGRTFVSPLLMK